jgi:hypothetical protein
MRACEYLEAPLAPAGLVQNCFGPATSIQRMRFARLSVNAKVAEGAQESNATAAAPT